MVLNFTTLRGTPTYGAGKFGNGLTAGILGTTTIISSTVGTMEAWVKTTSTAFKIAVGNNGAGYWLGMNSGKAVLGTPTTSLTSTVTINDGAWHHLAATVDGTTIRFWIDGTAGPTYAYAQPFRVGTATTAIGAYGTDTNYDWAGVVDEVRFSSVLRYTAAFTPPTSAFVGDANTLGLYHLEADGTDSAADTGSGGGPDTTAPTVPTGFTVTPGNGQNVLSWTASTDAVGVTGYVVYRGGVSIGTATGTSYTDSGLTNGTTYSYSVAAVDAAGNTSAQTSAVTGTPTAATGSTMQVAPNNANIVYSPYNWLVTGTVATTNTPGAYLRTTLQGSPTAITANFDMSTPPGTAIQLVVTVDGQITTIASMAATVTIAIPAQAGTPWSKQVVEIQFKSANGNDNRWNVPLAGAVKFLGFTAAPISVTASTTRRAPYNILAFGDSLLEGVSTNPGGEQDSRSGWGYPLRALLGCELGVVGFSGSGLNGTAPGNVPNWVSVWNQLWNGQARSFTTPTEPNVVLIQLGTNGMTQANALTVLNGVLAATTATKILVIQQWNGTTNKAAWQAAIAASTTPARITYLDTAGWFTSSDSNDGVHPWGYVNLVDIAPRLAAAIQPLLTGTTTFTPKRFINVGGTAKPIA